MWKIDTDGKKLCQYPVPHYPLPQYPLPQYPYCLIQVRNVHATISTTVMSKPTISNTTICYQLPQYPYPNINSKICNTDYRNIQYHTISWSTAISIPKTIPQYPIPEYNVKSHNMYTQISIPKYLYQNIHTTIYNPQYFHSICVDIEVWIFR